MTKKIRSPIPLNKINAAADTADGINEVQRQQTLLKTGALQNAIFNSANFSSIATDEKGIIQLFNIGAERMLGYLAADVLNKITPADISDPQEVIARQGAEPGTGHADYTRLCMEAGFFRYLTKPINEFAEALNKALEFAEKTPAVIA